MCSTDTFPTPYKGLPILHSTYHLKPDVCLHNLVLLVLQNKINLIYETLGNNEIDKFAIVILEYNKCREVLPALIKNHEQAALKNGGFTAKHIDKLELYIQQKAS